MGRALTALVLAAVVVLALLAWALLAPAAREERLDYEVLERLPHDERAYTQGLVFAGGVFYESTGRYGESTLREVDLRSGEVQRIRHLARELFGEGLTLIDGRLVQLTWRERRGLVYDAQSFELVSEFGYATEGWGLTDDGERLIMSDGSDKLYFLDAATYERLDEVSVRDARGPVENLNELEYVEGRIFANIYRSDRIVAIDPASGRVAASLDLGALVAEQRVAKRDIDVLNGIAYDAETGRLFVTGKDWPNLYVLRLIKR